MNLPELKVRILDFIVSHDIENGSDLYIKIINHVRQHGTREEPRRFHGGDGDDEAANPQHAG